MGRFYQQIFHSFQHIFWNFFLVVTGSSDGIGKAFAEELAKKGFNIVLAARNQEKLNSVAEEISRVLDLIFTIKNFFFSKRYIF